MPPKAAPAADAKGKGGKKDDPKAPVESREFLPQRSRRKKKPLSG